MTWVCLGIMLVSGTGLLALSWNGSLDASPRASLMLVLWVLMSASGIYLFLLAVKKAHRMWVDESRSATQAAATVSTGTGAAGPASDLDVLDAVARAHKVVRRIPAETRLEDLGQDLLHLLARELEIMSGILYLRKKTLFEASSTYALVSPGSPYTFSEGEGLSGQAAADRQIRVLASLPEGHLEVYSGLGKAKPSWMAIVPLVRRERTIALLECSGYRYAPEDIETFFRILARDLVEKLLIKK
jgi:hypothetical protein